MASYTTTGQADIGFPPRASSYPPYFINTYRKRTFTLTLGATTTAIAAGNIVGASAAAATQFALTNPSTSGVNLMLTKFFMGIISGTPAGGPIFHGYLATNPTLASIGGTILNNFVGDTTASLATPHSLAAGSALTGGSAPIVLRAAAFSTTATAQASVGEVNCLEVIDTDIIIPPGKTWLPLWSAAGTSVLNAYSVTWIEVGI